MWLRTSTLRHCTKILCLLAPLGLVACIPVRWTEPGSPFITGQIRGPDGLPASGLHVAVSGDLNAACRHPAAEVSTDKDGNFQLPNTDLVHRFFILLPFEKFTQLYRVCGGTDTTALSPAYDGHMAAHLSGATDSVSCFSWRWQAAMRVTCSSLSHERDLYGHEVKLVVTGGHWLDSLGRGSYRIISTNAGPWIVHPQLYLQWLRDSVVVSTMELTPLTKMTALLDPRLEFEFGEWSLVVTGFQGSDVQRTLLFQLGPPGHIRLQQF
jgi:hypothetical protein